MWTKNRGRADRARQAPCKEAVDRSHPGTTKLHRLEEKPGAANIELSAEDLREIENAASNIWVEGARYPENLQKMVGR